MGTLRDVLPEAAKKLYPEPVFFSIARRRVSAPLRRARRASGRDYCGKLDEQGLAPLRPGWGLALLSFGPV